MMEMGRIPDDPYAGYVEDDSELEYSDDESSEDEQGCDPSSKRESPGSSDEFEREMESEVMGILELTASPVVLQVAGTSAVKISKKQPCKPDNVSSKQEERFSSRGEDQPSVSTSGKKAKREEEEDIEYYDDAYFDSSSDEGGGDGEVMAGRGGAKKNKKRKFRKLTNDELFYDPHMDEEDEKWVNRQRMAYHNVKVSQQLERQKRLKTAAQDSAPSQEEGSVGTEEKASKSAKPEMALPRSDAILTCPACMTTLCLDCQRHEFYVNQYRAMFVLNCCILRDEVLRYIPKTDKRSRRRRRRVGKEEGRKGKEEGRKGKEEEASRGKEASQQVEPDMYHPVRCGECNTEVAVYDKQEVFHFFNVLASAP